MTTKTTELTKVKCTACHNGKCVDYGDSTEERYEYVCPICNGLTYELLTDEEIEYREVAKKLREEQAKDEKGIAIDLEALLKE